MGTCINMRNCKMKASATIFLMVAYLANLSQLEKIDFDPYDVFGVSRSVTSENIRKTYKKLVKEWHPDKNKSPDAEETFIRIQQAYEILSNEDKREQFDNGGYSDDNVRQWQSAGSNFRYSDFSHDFFYSQGSSRAINPHEFYHRVLPESHVTPQLIYVYSTFCMRCVLWLRTSWQKAATDLESLGVSVSTVDTTFSSQIASRLGVSQLPTIVGIYKERLYFFKGEINKEELKYFVTSFLPSDFIQRINSKTAADFLGEIKTDDKPRAILFSDKSSPTLLYTLMSIKYQHHIKFGFVDQRDGESYEFIQNMQVNRRGPTLLVFKENISKPAVVLGASEMPRGAINEILAGNKFVIVPRLTSQNVFDELCPSPANGAAYAVRLCFILVSDPSYHDFETITTNLKSLVESAQAREENMNDWLKFMRVDASKQPSFARSLGQKEEDESRIYLVWRRSSSTGSVRHYDVGFLRQELQLAEKDFQVCLRQALEAAHLQRFQKTVSLAPLVDELAPFIVIQVLRTMIDVTEQTYNIIRNMHEKSLMFLVIIILITVNFIYSLFSSDQASDPKPKKTKRQTQQRTEESGNKEETNNEETTPKQENSNPQEARKEKKSEFLVELLPINYESLVLQMARGRMSVVLLWDQEDANHTNLLEQFTDALRIYSRDPKISITYLNVREYSSWYFEIRRTSSAQPHMETDGEEASSLHGREQVPIAQSQSNLKEQSLKEIQGTVLVINGSRHWYCIFTPRGIKWGQDGGSGLPSQKRDSSEEETYEEALSCWLDRVREGQMPRLYVRQWPGLYIHPESEAGDEEDIF